MRQLWEFSYLPLDTSAIWAVSPHIFRITTYICIIQIHFLPIFFAEIVFMFRMESKEYWVIPSFLWFQCKSRKFSSWKIYSQHSEVNIEWVKNESTWSCIRRIIIFIFNSDAVKSSNDCIIITENQFTAPKGSSSSSMIF